KTAAKKAPSKNGAKPAAKKSPRHKQDAAIPKTPAAPHSSGKYFFAEPAVPEVGQSSRNQSPRIVQFNSPEQARAHAIDYLVDFIERCEEQLWNLKREASAAAADRAE